MFSQEKHPVVIIQDVEAGGPETEAFKCVDELIISDSDIFVQKSFNNAFLLQNGIAGFNDDEIKRIQLLRSVVRRRK